MMVSFKISCSVDILDYQFIIQYLIWVCFIQTASNFFRFPFSFILDLFSSLWYTIIGKGGQDRIKVIGCVCTRFWSGYWGQGDDDQYQLRSQRRTAQELQSAERLFLFCVSREKKSSSREQSDKIDWFSYFRTTGGFTY